MRDIPLILCLASGGSVLVVDLVRKLFRGEFGSDLLAGISIVTSVLLGEYLAGCLVVLMLSGGEALEAYAVRSASSVLEALARRIPSQAHRKSQRRRSRRPSRRASRSVMCLSSSPTRFARLTGRSLREPA